MGRLRTFDDLWVVRTSAAAAAVVAVVAVVVARTT